MISVIVCSIDPAKAAALHANVRETVGLPFEFLAYDNRAARRGIAAVYNDCARKARGEWLCFVHEDVAFRTPGWGAALAERLSDPRCGAVGFAGGVMKLRSVTGWCLDAHDARTSYRQPDEAGCMTHRSHNPAGERFSRAVCLDGFCLVTRREVWEASPFDERLLSGFHAYDLDFTIAAAQRFENWVCHTVEVEHRSAGAYSPAWREALETCHRKWRAQLPIFTAARPSERQIAALERRAEALWWRKLMRLGLCTPGEGARATARMLARHPFSWESWILLFKWLRYRIKNDRR